MPRFDPFYRRNPRPVEKRSVGPLANLTFDSGPPREFRLQLLSNLDRVIGERRNVSWTRASGMRELIQPSTIWKRILDEISHEFGFVPYINLYNPVEQVLKEWFLREDTPNTWFLSGVEIALHVIADARIEIAQYQDEYSSTLSLDGAIEDINIRFRQHSLPYDIDPTSLQIRTIDSDYLHAAVVAPALTLIRSANFRGAEVEFQKALEHHRFGREEEAISEALKAFESTLKQICDERDWEYDRHKDTAKSLISIVLANGLLPQWMTEQFTHLRLVLESGTPTVRNKTASHGTGTEPRLVPSYLAAYALHTSAANIVLLVEAHTSNSM